jgi:hypothetical protein
VIAALIAIVTTAYQALLSPEIIADPNPDPSLPFATHFTVKNESWLFSMQHAQFVCEIVDVRTPIINCSAPDGLILLDTETAIIEPENTAVYRCVVGKKNSLFSIESSDVNYAHIYVWMEYRTLAAKRISPKAEFTWLTDAKPGRWIKGKIVY